MTPFHPALSMEFAERVVAWLAAWTGQASVLIVVVCGVQAVCGRRLTSEWRSAVWLVVVARLLMPIAPDSRMSMFNVFNSQTDTAVSITSASARVESTERGGVDDRGVARQDAGRGAVGDHVWMLAVAWLAGLTVYGAWCCAVNVSHCRRLRRRSRPVDDAALLSLMQECRRRMNVQREVRLWFTGGLSGPAVSGWLRPTIHISRRMTRSMSSDEVRWVLLHELAHIRRHDVALNWLLIVAQGLHWFNPLVWWAVRRIRDAQEPACDELALRIGHEGSDEALSASSLRYAGVIIRVVESSRAGPRLRTVVGMATNPKQLERRIIMLDQVRRVGSGWSWMGLLVVMMVGCTGLTDAEKRNALDASPMLEPHAPQAGQVEIRMLVVALDETLLNALRADGALSGSGTDGAVAAHVQTAAEIDRLERRLRNESGARTINRPRIRLVNDQAGSVLVSKQSPYVVGYQLNGSDGKMRPQMKVLTTGMEMNTRAVIENEHRRVSLTVDGRYTEVDRVIVTRTDAEEGPGGAGKGLPMQSVMVKTHAVKSAMQVEAGSSLVMTSAAPTETMWPEEKAIDVKSGDARLTRLLIIMTPEVSPSPSRQ